MATPRLQYQVNLLDDGSVVTRDGEYLGTWDTDESDALFQFFPDGATEPLFVDPFFGLLCKTVDSSHSQTPCVETPL